MTTIIENLLPIFQNVFDDEDLVITPFTTAQDVDGWDSLAHIRLIVTIEKHFGLRFSAAEISDVENVGQMAELILSKQKDA
jgi:acyl carrier protein